MLYTIYSTCINCDNVWWQLFIPVIPNCCFFNFRWIESLLLKFLRCKSAMSQRSNKTHNQCWDPQPYLPMQSVYPTQFSLKHVENKPMPKLILWSPTYPSRMCDSRATSCYPLRLRTVWLWINRTEMSTSWPCKVAGSCQGRLPPFTTRFHWWHPPALWKPMWTSWSQGSPKKTKNGRSKPPSNKGPLAHTHSMPGILCCFSSGIAGCHRFLTIRLLAHLKQISPRTPEWHQNGRRHVKYVKPLSTPKVDSSLQKEKTTCDLAHSTTLTGPL
jgi:hypothetical protein